MASSMDAADSPPVETLGDATALSHALLETVAPAPGLTEALQAAVDTLSFAFAFDFGLAWVASPDGAHMTLGHATHGVQQRFGEFFEMAAARPVSRNVGMVGRAWSTNKPQCVVDQSLNADRTPLGLLAAAAGIKSVVAVPVFAGGEAVAIFSFGKSSMIDGLDGLAARIMTFLDQIGPTLLRKIASDHYRASAEQNAMLVKEVHHRVKNNLALITSLLSLQQRQTKDAGARRALAESQARVHSMALVHEQLYRSNQMAELELGGYLTSLCEHLSVVFGTVAHGLRIVPRTQRVTLDLDQAIPCGLLVQELITNSLKYAFPEGRNGTVEVVLETLSPHRCRLIVRDDGVGMSNERESDSGLGLELVQALSAQMSGEMRVESGDGTCVTLEFPTQVT